MDGSNPHPTLTCTYLELSGAPVSFPARLRCCTPRKRRCPSRPSPRFVCAASPSRTPIACRQAAPGRRPFAIELAVPARRVAPDSRAPRRCRPPLRPIAAARETRFRSLYTHSNVSRSKKPEERGTIFSQLSR